MGIVPNQRPSISNASCFRILSYVAAVDVNARSGPYFFFAGVDSNRRWVAGYSFAETIGATRVELSSWSELDMLKVALWGGRIEQTDKFED